MTRFTHNFLSVLVGHRDLVCLNVGGLRRVVVSLAPDHAGSPQDETEDQNENKAKHMTVGRRCDISHLLPLGIDLRV